MNGSVDSFFQSPYVDPASKIGDKWEAHLRQRDQHAIRAHNPAEGRHAFFCISRSTKVTLYYQNEGPGWQMTSLVLDSPSSSQEFLSHAAFGEHGSDVLVITHDCSSRFRLYKISIKWNASQPTRQPNVAATLVSPSLDVVNLTAVDNIRTQHADPARLCHLHIVPAVLDGIGLATPNSTTIVAIFVHAALSTEAAPAQGPYSVISRWYVESFIPTMHESFKKSKSGSDSMTMVDEVTTLRRQPDIMTSKIVLCFGRHAFDTILAFGASDGTVDLRDRNSMNSLEPTYGDTLTVSSFPQSGIEHLPGENHVDMAMSADASVLALIRHDRKVIANIMAFRYGWQVVEDGISDNKDFIEAAVVCIARQYALLSYSNISNDETLAILPPDLSSETKAMVIKLIFRIMNRSPDISTQDNQKQQMIVLRDPLIPRVLSAQLGLDTDPITGGRNLAAQFAYVVLNLRLVGTSFMQTLCRPNQTSLDSILSLRGLVRWCTDLMIFIVDSLVDIKRSVGVPTRQALEQKCSTTNNPALHLLLCSFSRALLRFQNMWVGKYFQIIQAALPRARSITERHQLMEVFELASKMPFKPTNFEQMVSEFDTAIRSAYLQSDMAADRRSTIEIAMICEGVVPDELENPVVALLETMLTKLCEGIDMGKLYFWNTEWLSLANISPKGSLRRYDIIKKTPLTKDMSLRLCRRCGAQMEDIPPEKLREMPRWFAQVQRHCVCSDFWIPV